MADHSSDLAKFLADTLAQVAVWTGVRKKPPRAAAEARHLQRELPASRIDEDEMKAAAERLRAQDPQAGKR